MKIKTLIAAGGLGKRLQGYRGNESTKVLLEVNNTPMIKLQIQKLIEWGLEDFVIITNPQYDKLIKDVTSSIEGINIDYVAQNEPKGISHAFLQAENKINNDEAIVCVLGDNFFGENLLNDVNFENFVQNQNSLIFTKEVNNPEEFGVASIGKDQKVIEIIEKPKNPVSNLAVVGVYVFDHSMFNKIKTLKPSKRGELEITDLINIYIDESSCEHIQLNSWWVDAGTPDRIMELEKNLS
jgi:glucose-1-phosphate thymidylyltransferase